MTEKNLDVILIGETHTDLKQAYEIARIIEEHKPEYVLYEGFDKEDTFFILKEAELLGLGLYNLFKICGVPLGSVGFTEEIVNKDKLEERLLKAIEDLFKEEVFEKYGMSPLNMEFVKKNLNKERFKEELLDIAKKYNKMVIMEYSNAKIKNKRELYLINLAYLYYTFIDLEYLPNTYEEIISRPLVTYHPAILDYFLKIMEEKREELLNKEHHNRKLERLLITFDVVGNVMYFIKSISEEFRELLRDLRSRIYIILSAVYKVNAKIGECDLNSEEKYKKLEECLEGKISWAEFHSLREIAMADSIEKYVEKRETKAPIIAIMGKAHVDNVAKLLENRGIKYTMVKLEDSIKDQELMDYIVRVYSTNIIGNHFRLSKKT